MRGCQRRVVFLKNTGSSIFEGAYFVLKEDKGREWSGATESDMVHEASRIIEENSVGKSKKLIKYSIPVLSFLIGAALSAFILLLIYN